MHPGRPQHRHRVPTFKQYMFSGDLVGAVAIATAVVDVLARGLVDCDSRIGPSKFAVAAEFTWFPAASMYAALVEIITVGPDII